MNIVDRFSAKSELYAAYRWDYDPAAIAALIAATGLRAGDPVADIGAGAGAVTRLLLAYGLHVTAVEPSSAMRRLATASLGQHPGFRSVHGLADATGLPAASVALITVGRAMHWFPPAPTRREFLRIVRPGGWLALLGVACTDAEITAATRSLQTEQNGWDVAAGWDKRPPLDLDTLFGGSHYRQMDFPGLRQETWEQFLGRLLSLSTAPGQSSPQFPRFMADAHALFDRIAIEGILTIPVATVMTLGVLRADA